MPPRRSFNKTDPIQGRTKQEQERLVNYYESRRPYMLVRAQNQATKKYNELEAERVAALARGNDNIFDTRPNPLPDGSVPRFRRFNDDDVMLIPGRTMRPVGRTTPAMANYGNASGIYGDALKNDYGLKLFDIQSTRMGSQTPHEFITKEIAPFLARAPGTLETTLRGSVGGFNNITGIVNENVRNMKGRLEYPDLIT